MSFFKVVLFLVVCRHGIDLRRRDNIPGYRYFTVKLDSNSRSLRRSAWVHSITRTESSADNFASEWNTTYLWGGISRFSITVAIAVRRRRWSAASRLYQRERLRCSRARFTSLSTSQETGATSLYQGQWVCS